MAYWAGTHARHSLMRYKRLNLEHFETPFNGLCTNVVNLSQKAVFSTKRQRIDDTFLLTPHKNPHKILLGLTQRL